MEEDIKKAEQAIAILKKMEMAGKLPPEKQGDDGKSIRTKIHFSNRIEELKGELIQIELRLQQEANGKVRAYDFIVS